MLAGEVASPVDMNTGPVGMFAARSGCRTTGRTEQRLASSSNGDVAEARRRGIERLRSEGYAVFPRKDDAAYLRRFGFSIATLIDVGVADGTPALYAAFPGVPLVLVDPLPEVARVAAALRAQGRAARHVAAALGAVAGRACFGVVPDRASRSGFHDRTALTAGPTVRKIEVAVETLDRVAAGLAPPFGLKIDTEGHELEVLRGAAATLDRTAFVQMEVSVKHRFVGGYRFADAIAARAGHGFVLLDILNLAPRSPKFLECLFVPEDSPLLDAAV